MSQQEHGCYEIKLNRFFNIFKKESVILAVVLLMLPLCLAIAGLVGGTFDIKKVGISAFFCLLIFLVSLLSHPKCLDVTPETVKYQYKKALRRLLTTGLHSFSKNEEAITLYRIQKIEYIQNSFEKAFHVGRVRIYGYTNQGQDYTEKSVLIYGVKDFENTAKWLQSYIRLVK